MTKKLNKTIGTIEGNAVFLDFFGPWAFPRLPKKNCLRKSGKNALTARNSLTATKWP